jgi:hypothetical protein
LAILNYVGTIFEVDDVGSFGFEYTIVFVFIFLRNVWQKFLNNLLQRKYFVLLQYRLLQIILVKKVARALSELGVDEERVEYAFA